MFSLGVFSTTSTAESLCSQCEILRANRVLSALSVAQRCLAAATADQTHDATITVVSVIDWWHSVSPLVGSCRSNLRISLSLTAGFVGHSSACGQAPLHCLAAIADSAQRWCWSVLHEHAQDTQRYVGTGGHGFRNSLPRSACV